MDINDLELLNNLEDIQKKSEFYYKPNNYWKPYVDRITDSIRNSGINEFRSNYKKSKGYLFGGILDLEPYGIAKSSLKFKIINVLSKIPLIKRLISYYDTRLKKLSEAAYLNLYTYYKSLIYLSPKCFSSLEDSLIGSPMTINGLNNISSTFVYSLHYAVELSQYSDIDDLEHVLEIGAGFGSFAEVICKLNKSVKYTILDISPISYISTQYLKNVFPDEVSDVRDYLNNVNKRITILPVSFIKDLKNIDFSLFVNHASFQEMEINTIKNYLSFIRAKKFFISSLIKGHKEKANNQEKVISFKDIEELCNVQGYFPLENHQNSFLNDLRKSGDLSIYEIKVFENKNKL
tara:strand:+ start:727 stop:1770 length:1044 start_codon:yes stop_codon:yes gene_type:complete